MYLLMACTSSRTLVNVPRRMAWRVMMPKKISTMLSQLAIFSLAVSAINEGITKAMAWRARHLWRNLRKLLDDEGGNLRKDERLSPDACGNTNLTDQLYAHPLVRQLDGRLPKSTSRSRLSRVPPPDFARALIDLLAPRDAGGASVEKVWQGVLNLPRRFTAEGTAPNDRE